VRRFVSTRPVRPSSSVTRRSRRCGGCPAPTTRSSASITPSTSSRVGACSPPRVEGARGARPSTAYEALGFHGDNYEVLVVATGYNDGTSGYADAFRAIVGRARALGYQQIVWWSLALRRRLRVARRGRQPRDVRPEQRGDRAAPRIGQYPDVVLADWGSYTADRGRVVRHRRRALPGGRRLGGVRLPEPEDGVPRRAAVPDARHARRAATRSLPRPRRDRTDRRHRGAVPDRRGRRALLRDRRRTSRRVPLRHPRHPAHPRARSSTTAART
jgi:hypothetical protein